MKATPAKISRCIRRMEKISESDETRSKRSIANQVAIEFSTVARNCYRWKYEWSAAKQDDIHKKAEAHLVGVVLPSQLKLLYAPAQAFKIVMCACPRGSCTSLFRSGGECGGAFAQGANTLLL